MKDIHYLENGILNTCFIDPAMIPQISEKIASDVFDNPISREIFELFEMAAADSRTDAEIKSIVYSDERFEDYFSSIQSIGIVREGFDEVCRKLSSAAKLRRIKDICGKISYDGSITLQEVVNQLTASLESASRQQRGVSRTVAQILKEGAAGELITATEESEGLRCSLDELNSIFTAKGNMMILLAARASMGKTALAMTLARDYKRQGKRGLFFSLEMTGQQLVKRLSSIETGIDLKEIGGLSYGGDLSRMDNFINSDTNENLIIYEKFSPSMAEIKIESIKRNSENKLDYIIIDYIQLIKGQKSSTREGQVAAISAACKELAKDLDVPVFVLAQLNRMAEGEVPKISHLRESGALEQDADAVIMLHRDRGAQAARVDGDPDPLQTMLSVAKNRDGRIGIVTVGFIPERAEFVNYNGKKF